METPSKDEKTLPMFTPKNSEGSQRVIKQIMVIDPNKLRVAGLDLKMAEALKKSKSSKGNSNPSRTKEDKLTLAKTLLNKKLKQVKFSKEAQNQYIAKEKIVSPQKLQSNVAVLQSLLSSPRTYIAPAPKQSHTMLVNITGNDQRTGSFEMSISNKTNVQPDKTSVDQIPKASIKMTKPVKLKEAPPKTIDSMVISPEVKFEVKRKSLPGSAKQICSDPLSNLPKVIESKVLSPEEKIDMKTLCGNSTKPVPATVRIEITKQETVSRTADSVSVPERPKEYVIAPETKPVLQAPQVQTNVRIDIPKQESAKKTYPLVVAVAAQEKRKEFVIAPQSATVKSANFLHFQKSAPKKGEMPVSAVKEESAVDFINSLQQSITSKSESKSQPEPKTKTIDVQEDATSFLMSLLAQQSNKVESNPIKAGEEKLPEKDTKSEKNSTPQGHRRNLKPLPIIKPRLRFSGVDRLEKSKPSSQAEAPSKTNSVAAAEMQTIEPKEICSDLLTAQKGYQRQETKIDCLPAPSASTEAETMPSPLARDKTDSLNKDMKSITDFLVSEMKSGSKTSEPKDLIEEPKSKSKEMTMTDAPKQKAEELPKKIPLKDGKPGIPVETSSLLTKTQSKDCRTKHEEEEKDAVSKSLKDNSSEEIDRVVQDTKVPIPVLVEESVEREATPKYADQELSASSPAQGVILISTQDAEKSEVSVKEIYTPKDDKDLEAKNVASNLTADCQKSGEIHQSRVQEGAEIDPSAKGTSVNETAPSAPQPASRRKGKKSVPVLIAKLKKSRKPACPQDETKEIQTHVPLVVDKSTVLKNESIEANKTLGDAASSSEQLLNVNTLTIEEKKNREGHLLSTGEDKIKEADKDLHHLMHEEDKSISTKPLPQEPVLPESEQMISKSPVLVKKCKSESKLEPVVNKSKTPTEGDVSKSKQEPVKIPSTLVEVEVKKCQKNPTTKKSETLKEMEKITAELNPANKKSITSTKVEHTKPEPDLANNNLETQTTSKLEPITATLTKGHISEAILEPVVYKSIELEEAEKMGVEPEPEIDKPAMLTKCVELDAKLEKTDKKSTTLVEVDKMKYGRQEASRSETKLEPMTKTCTAPSEVEEVEIMLQKISSENASEVSSAETSPQERRDEISAKPDDSTNDCPPVTQEVSVATTDESIQEMCEEIPTTAASTEHPQTSEIEKMASPSPKKKTKKKNETASTSDQKTPENQTPKGKRQMKGETPTDRVEETRSMSDSKHEAKSRPFPRVRKKENIALAPDATTSPVQETNEPPPDAAKQAYTEYLALSHVESPKTESHTGNPEPKKELSSKMKKCNEKLQSQGEREIDKAIQMSSSDTFDRIREEQAGQNVTAPLPVVNSNEKEDDSDEFGHHDSDFGVSFQDDAEFNDTAPVEEELPRNSQLDFDALKSNKTFHESKDDLDFLGFNEEEIEEGQHSTSLRLSQSEDMSSLNPTSQSETPVNKKTTPPVKKTPTSAGKKQKTEQKNWKKKSAKSLQNWLKSSDKDVSGKEGETSQKESPNETKAVDTHQKDVSKNSALSDTKLPPLSDQPVPQAKVSARGKKDAGKQEELMEIKAKPEKPPRKSINRGKVFGDPKEPLSDPLKAVKELNEHIRDETTTTSPACPKDSKTTTKSSAKGQRKKIKKEVLEENACAADDLNATEIANHCFTLDKVKVEKEAVEIPATSVTSSRSLVGASHTTGGTPSATPSAALISALSAAPSGTPHDTQSEIQPATPTTVLSGAKSATPSFAPNSGATSSATPIRALKKKRGPVAKNASAIEAESVPTPNQKMELDNSLSTTSKRKLETEEIAIKGPTVASTSPLVTPRQKRKYTRRSGVTSTPTENTPKSSRSRKCDESEEAQIPVKPEDPSISPMESNSRKRKASKLESGTPNKVAHISADPDFKLPTPTPKKRGPKKKVEVVDSPDVVITPKADRKYKNTAEFNPRLLLIRKKEDLKLDSPLVDATLQTIPKSKDDVQCALCMGYTPKKKWLQHVSDHYGVGWVVGTPPPLNITCRNAVLSYMIEFFKTSKVKGLNCRICGGLRRSALGLLAHLEQCCLTEEEVKESRLTCEHCKREYSKSSLPVHLRSCPELWKKNKAQNEPEQKVPEEDQEVALSNTGRLKRKSVIKAEHKFKDMDNADISPDEMIKHIPQPRKDHWEAAWQRDIKSFGKGFCVEKKCQFTAETVEELHRHCQPGVCPQFLEPGYSCMRCKFHADTVEATRKHVVDKHICPASEDFQDSEDEAVISQRSSSEDGSSGDEEISEEGSVDQEGGEKRKPKKKATSANKRARYPPKRNVPIKDIRKLVPPRIQKITSEVEKLHQEFIKQNHSVEPLFSYATPNVVQFVNDEIEAYFSKSPISPKFALRGFQKPFVEKLGETSIQPDQWQQLRRLDGMSSKCEHVMYLGGPVRAIAWVPLVTPTSPAYQYLASVTRKEQNKFARFLQPKQSRSLIYIHRYQLNDIDQKRIDGELYYALAIDEGPIHCIEFLPSGGYDPETNRLGLLAVGTVKSEVKVYSLPLSVQKQDCDKFPILRIEPSFVLGLELEEREDESSDFYRSQCTSITWSQFAGHNHVIGGYVNGFVSIWDITDEDDNLNRFLVNGIRKFVPVSYFWSKDDRIKRVSAHYDLNGLRWLMVCTAPRRLVFYDIRDINRPLQIMDERTKNECTSVDWPVVWANPAFGLGDSLPTHGNCLNSISPSALAYVSKKFEKFCCGVTDLHFNPWNNMYAAGAENGDIQVTPLRDTILDVSLRKRKDEKIVTSLDIVPLNGGEVSESIVQSSRLLEMDYSDKFGIVFGPIKHVIGVKTPQLYSRERIPPLALTRLTRVNQVRFNPNQMTNTFLAVGYANGMMRVLVNKWEDPLKTL